MKTIAITVYPYAVQTGHIDIPDDISSEKNRNAYIRYHWNDIRFNAPEPDYCGTDIDICTK